MKVTMHNKDDIARQIANKAWKHPDDAVSNNMLRVSDALTNVGEVGSPFRTLDSLNDEFIPASEMDDTNVTYAQALLEAIEIISEETA